MRLLSSGPDDPVNGLIHDERPVFPTVAHPAYVLPNPMAEPDAAQSFNVLSLVKRYWLLSLSLMILGSAAGFASVVLSAPMYKTLLLAGGSPAPIAGIYAPWRSSSQHRNQRGGYSNSGEPPA